MQLPDIHLNGSDPESLLTQYMTALEKCQEAAQALSVIDVNARDYYRLPGNAASVARAEHDARCSTFRATIADLSAIAEHLQDNIR